METSITAPGARWGSHQRMFPLGPGRPSNAAVAPHICSERNSGLPARIRILPPDVRENNMRTVECAIFVCIYHIWTILLVTLNLNLLYLYHWIYKFEATVLSLILNPRRAEKHVEFNLILVANIINNFLLTFELKKIDFLPCGPKLAFLARLLGQYSALFCLPRRKIV